MSSDVLQEMIIFDYNTIVENTESGKQKLILSGLFQKSDVVNANKRRYPKHILEREINNAIEKVKGRNMLGELDHPKDGVIHLDKVSHVITNLSINENGEVTGQLEVFDGADEDGGTPAGRILASLIKRNIKIGISSRGAGTLSKNGGLAEVNNDYKLITFDVVANPSTQGAYPTRLSESEDEISDWLHEKEGFLDILENNLND